MTYEPHHGHDSFPADDAEPYGVWRTVAVLSGSVLLEWVLMSTTLDGRVLGWVLITGAVYLLWTGFVGRLNPVRWLCDRLKYPCY